MEKCNLSNGFTIALIDSMYPIELPYYPTTFTQYIVHEDRYAIETTEVEDYDTIHIKYAIDKKNDVYLPINRYFTEIGIEDSNDFREITKEEFDKLMNKRRNEK